MRESENETRLKSAAIRGPREFALAPDAAARSRLAGELGIRAIRKLRFAGVVRPEGGGDLALEAMLGATVVQDCVVTFAPVTTRIDEPVARRYLADMPEPGGGEVEMPEDDTAEALPETIDLAQVMAEALALALPPWPRSPGAGPVDLSLAAPGADPLDGDSTRPFAALRSLRGRLGDEDGDEG